MAWREKLAEIYVEITSKTGPLKSAMARASAIVKRGAQTIVRWTKRAALAILAMGVASVKMAANVVESENLFEISMGKMASATRKWSKGLAKALHLNAFEIRKFTGVFNVMLTSMGFGIEKAAEMSQRLTMLAYDMASFYDIPFEEAFGKIQAGLTGIVRPLKRLGILIHESVIKQYALNNAIGDGSGKLTELEKVEARYGALLMQTTKAQGDWQRTMNRGVNVFRSLWSQIKITGIEIGLDLLPSIVKVVLRMRAWIEANRELILQKVDEYVHRIGKAVEVTGRAFGAARKHWKLTTGAVIVLYAAIVAVLSSMVAVAKFGIVKLFKGIGFAIKGVWWWTASWANELKGALIYMRLWKGIILPLTRIAARAVGGALKVAAAFVIMKTAALAAVAGIGAVIYKVGQIVWWLGKWLKAKIALARWRDPAYREEQRRIELERQAAEKRTKQEEKAQRAREADARVLAEAERKRRRLEEEAEDKRARWRVEAKKAAEETGITEERAYRRLEENEKKAAVQLKAKEEARIKAVASADAEILKADKEAAAVQKEADKEAAEAAKDAARSEVIARLEFLREYYENVKGFEKELHNIQLRLIKERAKATAKELKISEAAALLGLKARWAAEKAASEAAMEEVVERARIGFAGFGAAWTQIAAQLTGKEKIGTMQLREAQLQTKYLRSISEDIKDIELEEGGFI